MLLKFLLGNLGVEEEVRVIFFTGFILIYKKELVIIVSPINAC